MKTFYRFSMDSEAAKDYMENLRAACFGDSQRHAEAYMDLARVESALEFIQVICKAPDRVVEPLDLDITIEWDDMEPTREHAA